MKTLFTTTILLSGLLSFQTARAHEKQKDYDQVLDLNEVTVGERKNTIHTERLPDVHNTYITAGKKSEVIQIDGVMILKTCPTPSNIVFRSSGSARSISSGRRAGLTRVFHKLTDLWCLKTLFPDRFWKASIKT